MRFKHLFVIFFVLVLFRFSIGANLGIISPPTSSIVIKLQEIYAEGKKVKLSLRDKMLLKKLRRMINSIVLNQQSIVSKSLNETVNRIKLRLQDDENACFTFHTRCSKYVNSLFLISGNLEFSTQEELYSFLSSLFNFPYGIPNCFKDDDPISCIAQESGADIILYVDFILSDEFDEIGRVKTIEINMSSLLYQTGVIQNALITIERAKMRDFNYLKSKISEKTMILIKESLETLRNSSAIREKNKKGEKSNESLFF